MTANLADWILFAAVVFALASLVGVAVYEGWRSRQMAKHPPVLPAPVAADFNEAIAAQREALNRMERVRSHLDTEAESRAIAAPSQARRPRHRHP